MVGVPNTCCLLKLTYNSFNNEDIGVSEHLKIKELVDIGNGIINTYIIFPANEILGTFVVIHIQRGISNLLVFLW